MGQSVSLDQLVAATPETRDRYVDFLRAFSIAAVVFGHWLVALIHWEGGRIFVHNAVGHQSGLWMATWLLQVMPLFFFVGGFANLRGWSSTTARGDSYRDYLRRRLNRLLKPAVVFLAVWIGIEVVLHLTDTGASGLFRGTFLPFGPLWFLGVYGVVVAVAPLMLWLHRHWGVAVLVALAGSVAVVDVVRFGFLGRGIGWVNLALVWLFVHQLGFFYGDGRLVATGRRVWWAMVAGGLGVLVVLTNLELFFDELWYPRSMVGVDVEPVSNMSPPSFAIVALAVWQVGAAMLLRNRVSGWLATASRWKAVVGVNTIIMTLFLWHLTALLVVILVLHPLGVGHPVEPTASWWLQRPIWVLAPAVALVPLVVLFARFERPRSVRSDRLGQS
ncbi:MAG: acyltransferase family protein [Acidimicrobiia bacterium]